jgi:hypothetical protein
LRARIEYYQLGGSETQGLIDSAKESDMEAMESIASTLSVEGDDDIWMELQYSRDYNHCKEVYARMEKDKSLEPATIIRYSSIRSRSREEFMSANSIGCAGIISHLCRLWWQFFHISYFSLFLDQFPLPPLFQLYRKEVT